MSWLSDLFGGSAKKEKQRAEEQRAANSALISGAAKPYESLTDIPVGKSINDTILAALNKGQGIGYGPEFIGQTTAPGVASREARFREGEIPALSSELSSRGLGRSTIAGNAIQKAGTQKERDINQLISNATLMDYQQRKADQARYEGLGMNWTGEEAAQKGNYSADALARANALTGINNQYYGNLNDISAQGSQNINQLIGTGMKYILPAALAPVTGGASLAMYGALGISDLMNEYKKADEAGKASAFTKKPITNAWV
jgi:hypothetical protein